MYNPIYNWTGFYVGINGGGGWGNSQWDGLNKFDLSGGMIGGTIGYNWQVGQIVVGAEGDIDWSGVKGNTGVLCGASCETRNKWLATVRGRLGYAFDRFLPYITAGLAAGDINATRPGFPGGSSSNAGWTVGAGLEFGIASNVSIKAEYLYVDLGDFNCGRFRIRDQHSRHCLNCHRKARPSRDLAGSKTSGDDVGRNRSKA